MFASGLVDEVERIVGAGFAPEAKPFESHGYRQALQMLRGELNAKEALFYAQRNTRNYAKRQMTWFRKEPEMEWLKGFGEDEELQRAALESRSQILDKLLTSGARNILEFGSYSIQTAKCQLRQGAN